LKIDEVLIANEVNIANIPQHPTFSPHFPIPLDPKNKTRIKASRNIPITFPLIKFSISR
jgi:hypothetical protein